ncbi:MAG: hypothetical protein M5U28_06855 [Sandaracinaceae bacterium]|nr:hypothetical protein [Sandaracinaceae bacterium]
MGHVRLADPSAPPSRKPSLRQLQRKLRGVVTTHRLVLELRWVRATSPPA